MPKHKTTYIAWRANVTGASGLPDQFGVVAWDVEAWNAAHAIRLVRSNPDYGGIGSEKIAVVPARYFREG